MTQSEIAEVVGCSQMQVYRLLRLALAKLRDGAAGQPAERFSTHWDGYLSTGFESTEHRRVSRWFIVDAVEAASARPG